MNKYMQEVVIGITIAVVLTIGGCIQDSVFVNACEKYGMYVPVTAPDKLIECYTVEHVDEELPPHG